MADSRRDDLETTVELQEKFAHAGNYITISALLLSSMLIGAYFWWKGHKNTEDYHLGGRNMTTLPVTLSMVTSFISAVTLLSTPALYYSRGTQYVTHIFSMILQIWIALKFYHPVLGRMKLTTSYQYLERRFCSKFLRSIVSLYFTLTTLLYLAVAVVAPSMALEQVTGMNKYLSCALLFGVCGLYTCLGGIKAVMWTDALQFTFMLGSFIALAWVGTKSTIVQTAGTVFDRNYRTEDGTVTGRVELFNFDPDPRVSFTIWTTVIGNTFNGVQVFGTCQTSVQRFLSCKNEETARRAMFYTSVGMIAISVACLYMGMLVFAFYYNCDPISMGQIRSGDRIVPLFVMQVMGDYPGLPGLLVAGLLSGTLSTVSSGLNSMSTVLLQDGLLSYGACKSWTNERKIILSRCLACGFCVLSYSFTFLFINVTSLIGAALSVLQLVAGPVLGVFTLGMFMPFANRYGALLGFFVAFVLQGWMFIGYLLYIGTCTRPIVPPPLAQNPQQCPADWVAPAPRASKPNCHDLPGYLALYDLSFFWHAAVGWLCVLFVGTITSWATGFQAIEHLEPGVITDVGCLFSWWPRRIRTSIGNYLARAPRIDTTTVQLKIESLSSIDHTGSTTGSLEKS